MGAQLVLPQQKRGEVKSCGRMCAFLEESSSQTFDVGKKKKARLNGYRARKI